MRSVLFRGRDGDRLELRELVALQRAPCRLVTSVHVRRIGHDVQVAAIEGYIAIIAVMAAGCAPAATEMLCIATSSLDGNSAAL